MRTAIYIYIYRYAYPPPCALARAGVSKSLCVVFSRRVMSFDLRDATDRLTIVSFEKGTTPQQAGFGGLGGLAGLGGLGGLGGFRGMAGLGNFFHTPAQILPKS